MQHLGSILLVFAVGSNSASLKGRAGATAGSLRALEPRPAADRTRSGLFARRLEHPPPLQPQLAGLPLLAARGPGSTEGTEVTVEELDRRLEEMAKHLEQHLAGHLDSFEDRLRQVEEDVANAISNGLPNVKAQTAGTSPAPAGSETSAPTSSVTTTTTDPMLPVLLFSEDQLSTELHRLSDFVTAANMELHNVSSSLERWEAPLNLLKTSAARDEELVRNDTEVLEQLNASLAKAVLDVRANVSLARVQQVNDTVLQAENLFGGSAAAHADLVGRLDDVNQTLHGNVTEVMKDVEGRLNDTELMLLNGPVVDAEDAMRRQVDDQLIMKPAQLGKQVEHLVSTFASR